MIGCDQSTGMKDCELLFVIITSLNITINLCVCVQYMYEDPKLVKVLSAKMQHTEATHTQWYEGVALRKDMLAVVQRINNDLSSGKLHISNTKQVYCTSGTGYNAHTVSEKWPPTQQRNTSLNAKPKQLSIYNFINIPCDVIP